eukprot:1030591-Rhodomonas_salina.2
MAAAMIAAQAAAGALDRTPFQAQYVSNTQAGVRRSDSRVVLENLQEVLPDQTQWLRNIDVWKMSQKGKWEARQLTVTQSRVFLSRAGRVLETIPLEEIRHVAKITPRDAQSSATEYAGASSGMSPLSMARSGRWGNEDMQR